MFLEFDFVGGPFYKKYPNFETRFFGVWAWPTGPWVQVTRPKITCKEPWKVGPENFTPIRLTVQKLGHFFIVRDTRTDI